MTLPQPLSILYNINGSKNGAARSGVASTCSGPDHQPHVARRRL